MELREEAEQSLLRTRFWLVVVAGGAASLFGILANALLTRLFLTRLAFRLSPFFFLGFVALFDTLLDAVYILLLIPPVLSEQFHFVGLYLIWLRCVNLFYLLGQIFKLSSVLCLIVASFERYLITSHWTFSGFEERTRWLLLTLVLCIAVGIRFSTSVDVVILLNAQSTVPFKRYTAGQITHKEWLPNFSNLLTVIVPFGTLVFFNGGIVLMLRQQNVQQLRSLITELTMGYDFMKVRRRNIRGATNTLLLIISIYLISNMLSLFLSVSAFLSPGFLQRYYPDQYRISSDCASLLTVVGNALRFPAHFFSNGEVREHCRAVFCVEKKVPIIGNSNESLCDGGNFGLRRHSERLDNPWFSALLTTRQSTRRISGHTRNNSMAAKSLLVGDGRRERSRHRCTEELEAYLRVAEGGEAEEGKGGQRGAGRCAVCNGTMEEECCSGGALGTERDSMDEELFAREDGEDGTREDEDRLMMVLAEGAGSTSPAQYPPDMIELCFDPVEFSSVQHSL